MFINNMKTLKQYISLDEKLLSLNNYILEADESDEMDMDALNSDNPDGKTDDVDLDDDKKKKLTRRGNFKFTIWEEPKK